MAVPISHPSFVQPNVATPDGEKTARHEAQDTLQVEATKVQEITEDKKPDTHLRRTINGTYCWGWKAEWGRKPCHGGKPKDIQEVKKRDTYCVGTK